MAEARDSAMLERRPDSRVAAGLSLVPGLGQLYNGQPRKAILFLLATVLTIGPAVLLITAGEGFGHSLLAGHHFGPFLVVSFGSVLLFLLLFVLGLYTWASAATDAHHTARALREGDLEQAEQVSHFHL